MIAIDSSPKRKQVESKKGKIQQTISSQQLKTSLSQNGRGSIQIVKILF